MADLILGRKSDGSLKEIAVTDDGEVKIEFTGEGGTATAALQTTGNTSLSSIDGKVPAKGTAAMSASTPVTLATDDTQTAAILLALNQPTRIYAITPSDSTDLSSTVTKGLIVTVAGALALKLSGDSTAVTLAAVAVGQYIPGKILRVMLTNTTATVVGLGG